MGLRLGSARPSTKRRVVRFAVVIVSVVVVAVGAYIFAQQDGAEQTTATTAVVQRGTVTLAAAASGTIEAAQTRGLSFSVSGTVTELNVKAGDTVTKGKVLARIDDDDAQDAVDSAEERVENAEDAVERAEEALTASSSCTTAATQAAAGSTSGTGGSSSGGSSGGQGGSSSCSTKTSTTDNLLSAEQQLNNAKLTLTQAKTDLAGTVIKAPIGGRVLSVGGVVGSTVSPGGTGFIVIGSVDDLAVKVQFSEADVNRIAVGQVATITMTDRDDEYTGKVSQIDPAGTISSQLVRYGVVIAFDDVPDDVLLGQSANVTITTASAENVLYVASTAVTEVSGSTGSVTVRGSDGDVPRTVQIGLRGDQYTEISSGLAEGDKVVIASS